MALLCIPLTIYLAKQLNIQKPAYLAWFLVLSPSFSSWATGGLESSLTAFLFLVLIIAYFFFLKQPSAKNTLFVLLSSLLYLLVRPESFFVLLAMLIALSVFCYYSSDISVKISQLAFLFISNSLFFIVIALIRQHVYGQFFPQPVFAKASGFSLHKILSGLQYFLISGQLSIIIYSLIAIYLGLAFFKIRRIALLPAILLALSLAQLAFIIFSGGDWMTTGRFFVPIIPLLVLLFFLSYTSQTQVGIYCHVCTCYK